MKFQIPQKADLKETEFSFIFKKDYFIEEKSDFFVCNDNFPDDKKEIVGAILATKLHLHTKPPGHFVLFRVNLSKDYYLCHLSHLKKENH